jgi:energy-coupling factor transporter ATP-binding protein EcfA2
MQKIDRLGWAAGIAFTAYGCTVGIRVSDRNVLERVEALLPPGWKPAATPTVRQLYSLIVGGPTSRGNVRRFNLLYSGIARLMRTHDLDDALRLLEIEMERYIAEGARRRVFVHAGVVGWNGRAIVIPGRSGSGKSTLVQALVGAGATYYSDEFAVLDARGRVHPYPIPLGIRQAQDGVPPVKRSVEALGGVAGTRPLPVGLVLVTRYAGRVRFHPRPLSAGRAVLELLRNTLPARREPERVLATLTRIAAQAVGLRGPRGEAEETARQLLGSELVRRLGTTGGISAPVGPNLRTAASTNFFPPRDRGLILAPLRKSGASGGTGG